MKNFHDPYAYFECKTEIFMRVWGTIKENNRKSETFPFSGPKMKGWNLSYAYLTYGIVEIQST